MNPDFSFVTERPGIGATSEQRSMLYTRYHLAKSHSAGKDVLEVGCGAGLGLGYLAQSARSVIGGDIDESNLRIAAGTYRGRQKIEVRKQDAEQLDCADSCVDTLLLFEAIYYLRDAGRFVAEAQRVLRPQGMLILCSVNRRWQGFNPSPHSVRYFDADELRSLLDGQGFQVQMLGAFPDRADSLAKRLISTIRRCAVRFRLIPKTMKGKEWLKRLFYGRLATLDPEVRDDMAALAPFTELAPHVDSRQFKVLYAVAKSGKQSSARAA